MAIPTIRTLWGLAKSPELRMADEDLYLLVQAHTGKEKMHDLTQREIGILAGLLIKMKDSAVCEGRRVSREHKGNQTTANQRKKIWKLAETLGWGKRQINGMCQRMFQVDAMEWLSYQQCSKLIEALKAMEQRNGERKGGE